MALLLTALALGFFAAARHSRDHRSGWLLSSAAATGLAVAPLYKLIAAANTAAITAAALACFVIVLVITRVAPDASAALTTQAQSARRVRRRMSRQPDPSASERRDWRQSRTAAPRRRGQEL
jgi:ABC-type transport system involved in cytochrome bd biosynthesis fused ATPase/permease subunit